MESAQNRYKIGAMVGKRSQTVFNCLKPLAFWAVAIALSSLSVQAQKGGSSGGGSGGARGNPGGVTNSRPTYSPAQPGIQPGADPGLMLPTITPQPMQKPVVADDESCLPWDLPTARNASVSAIRLAVPEKARSHYEKACGAFKKKKLTEAEQQARDAIQKYPKYPAAWIMLGQVLQDEQKMDEAHEACMQPMKVEPAYLPPYLCLAGLLDREGKWDDLVTWSDRFQGLNLTADMYSNYYRGLALFHLQNFPEAQKCLSKAIDIDMAHHQPAFNFLMAQIYGQQGNMADASAQIQQFVKYSSSKQDKDAAKEYLTGLQSQQIAK
jgi:Flp pilus assembly protein TadD